MDHLVLFMYCVWHAFASVHFCLVVTCLFVMFIVILLFSHFVSLVRCGTGLYRFLVLAVFLTLLKIDNPYFEHMVGQIYPTKQQLNKENSPNLDLDMSIRNGRASSKIYDKQNDFNFEIMNFTFLDGDVPRSPSYGEYILQLIRFARVCSNVDIFIT